jgi:hypothetical protein
LAWVGPIAWAAGRSLNAVTIPPHSGGDNIGLPRLPTIHYNRPRRGEQDETEKEIMMTSGFMLMALTLPFMAAPPDAKAEADARLDAVLREWAKASDAVHEAHFTIRISERDSITEEKSTSSMEVSVRKPDLMRVDYKSQKSGPAWFIYKDRTVRLLSSSEKKDRFYTLSDEFGFPEHPDRHPDDFLSSIGGGFLEQVCWIAYGLPVGDLKSRFDFRLSKEDDNYIYIEIEPRHKDGWMPDNRMQVVLNRKTYQIRRLWIENSTETTYDYERPHEESAESITPESILKGLPEDYKKVDMGQFIKDDGDPNRKAIELLKP